MSPYPVHTEIDWLNLVQITVLLWVCSCKVMSCQQAVLHSSSSCLLTPLLLSTPPPLPQCSLSLAGNQTPVRTEHSQEYKISWTFHFGIKKFYYLSITKKWLFFSVIKDCFDKQFSWRHQRLKWALIFICAGKYYFGCVLKLF